MSHVYAAFYASLEEMKKSYAMDFQMIDNYGKALATGSSNMGDHITLLQDQLSLLIETIEQMVKSR